MSMSATPRSARLSSPGEVVAILVASAAVWIVLVAVIATLFLAVFIPTVEFSGRGDIPDDFPVYPGAGLDSAFASHSGGCTTVEAGWSSPAAVQAVVVFYQERLAGGGWTITDSRMSGTATVIAFQSASGPHREGYVSIQAPPYAGKTNISLTLVKSTASSECHAVVGVVG